MNNVLYVSDSANGRLTSNGNCIFNLFKSNKNSFMIVFGSQVNINDDNFVAVTYEKQKSKFIRNLFFVPSDDKFVSVICSSISEIIKKNSIKKVVFSYQPIEFLLAFNKLQKKYKNVTFVPFLLDNPYQTFNHSKNWFKRCFLSTKYRIIVPLILNRFSKKICLEFYKNNIKGNNTFYVGIPLLKPSLFVKKNKGLNNEISYFGSLSTFNRNPKDVLNNLQKLNIFNKISLYTNYQTDEFNEDKTIIFLEPITDKKKYEKILKESNLLLNIGNLTFNCVPGKLIEYISTGKAIINFVYYKTDPSIEIIKKYGNGLSILVDDPQARSKIISFLNSNKVIANFREIEEKFPSYLPSYINSLI